MHEVNFNASGRASDVGRNSNGLGDAQGLYLGAHPPKESFGQRALTKGLGARCTSNFTGFRVNTIAFSARTFIRFYSRFSEIRGERGTSQKGP